MKMPPRRARNAHKYHHVAKKEPPRNITGLITRRESDPPRSWAPILVAVHEMYPAIETVTVSSKRGRGDNRRGRPVRPTEVIVVRGYETEGERKGAGPLPGDSSSDRTRFIALHFASDRCRTRTAGCTRDEWVPGPGLPWLFDPDREDTRRQRSLFRNRAASRSGSSAWTKGSSRSGRDG